jgi:hypothetical protein
VTISQTWNDAAVAFTALKVNAAGTSDANSASGSLLLDLQVGGVSKLSVLKNGDLSIRNTGIIGTPNFLIGNSSSSGIYFASGDLRLYVDASSTKFAMSSATTSVKIGSNYSFGWAGSPDASQTLDTILVRDSASGNTLALRNGAAAQTFRVYNTYTDASNYSRLKIGWDAVTYAAFTIEGQQLGTGGGRSLALIGGGNVLGLGVAPSGSFNWVINSGHFLAGTDNTYDIGASGANRPRNVYVGTIVQASAYQVTGSGINALGHNGIAITLGVNTSKTQVESTLLCFSGNTSSFPAFKRVGTDFQVVNAGTTAALNVAAPDADLTFIEDRFRRKGAGTPEAAVTAPIGAVYHRTDGGAGTSFYVKESGTGNTGWVAK